VRKNPRKSQERIDAEAARELLGLQHPDQAPTEHSDDDIWAFWHVQSAIMKGDRAHRLAELHTEVTRHPENKTAATEREQIMEQLYAIALAALAARKKQIGSGEYLDLWRPNLRYQESEP
jgi:hypothetical protein